MSAARTGVERARRPQQGRQRAPVDELHHDEVGPAVLAPVEDRDDVGVREVGRGLGLPAEPLDEGAVDRELGEQHLEGDRAVEQAVVGPVDLGHAPAGDEVRQLVAVREDARRLRPVPCRSEPTLRPIEAPGTGGRPNGRRPATRPSTDVRPATCWAPWSRSSWWSPRGSPSGDRQPSIPKVASEGRFQHAFMIGPATRAPVVRTGLVRARPPPPRPSGCWPGRSRSSSRRCARRACSSVWAVPVLTAASRVAGRPTRRRCRSVDHAPPSAW